MLRVLFASPHSPRVVLLAKMKGAVVIGGGQALLVLVIAMVLPAINFEFQYGVAASLAIALLAVLLLNLLLAGLGQVLASRIRSMQGFHLVMNLVLFPFLFFSGAFFPLDDLPAWLKALGLVNPLSYAVDMLHLALYADGADGYFGLPIDIVVLGSLAIAMFLLGTGRRISAE
jgi:ABC-2 type transport system permease protein